MYPLSKYLSYEKLPCSHCTFLAAIYSEDKRKNFTQAVENPKMEGGNM